MSHRNDRNGETTDRHDDILNQVTQHDAVHAAKHKVKNSKQSEDDAIKMSDILWCDIKWHIILHFAPWNKNFNELSKAHKTVRQKSKTSYQCKRDHYCV